MPVSALAPLLKAAKDRLPGVVDASEPADSDVEQLRSAVVAVLAADRDSAAPHEPADLQDLLHITSKLWVSAPPVLFCTE